MGWLADLLKKFARRIIHRKVHESEGREHEANAHEALDRLRDSANLEEGDE